MDPLFGNGNNNNNQLVDPLFGNIVGNNNQDPEIGIDAEDQELANEGNNR